MAPPPPPPHTHTYTHQYPYTPGHNTGYAALGRLAEFLSHPDWSEVNTVSPTAGQGSSDKGKDGAGADGRIVDTDAVDIDTVAGKRKGRLDDLASNDSLRSEVWLFSSSDCRACALEIVEASLRTSKCARTYNDLRIAYARTPTHTGARERPRDRR